MKEIRGNIRGIKIWDPSATVTLFITISQENLFLHLCLCLCLTHFCSLRAHENGGREEWKGGTDGASLLFNAMCCSDVVQMCQYMVSVLPFFFFLNKKIKESPKVFSLHLHPA